MTQEHVEDTAILKQPPRRSMNRELTMPDIGQGVESVRAITRPQLNKVPTDAGQDRGYRNSAGFPSTICTHSLTGVHGSTITVFVPNGRS